MSKYITSWIGVDLDQTLAYYDEWHGAGHIGEPIPEMKKRVDQWLSDGKDVRIFTARVSNPHDELVRALEIEVFTRALEQWCIEHFGKSLPVTCSKDMGCVAIYDDRAKQVEPNTGELIEDYMHMYKDLCR